MRYLKLMPNVRKWIDDTTSLRKEFSNFLYQQANDTRFNTNGMGIHNFLIQPLQRVVGYMLMLQRPVPTFTLILISYAIRMLPSLVERVNS